MTTESINAKSFYREVVSSGSVWTIQIDKGVPTFDYLQGKSRFFVWSTRDRVMRSIKSENLFQGCKPLEIPWVLFSTKYLPDLAEQQLVFILNWSGHDNSAWEESAEEIAMNMEQHIELHQIELHQDTMTE